VLQSIKNHYELTAPLGTGGFAKVFKGKNKKDNRDVAIKHITLLECVLLKASCQSQFRTLHA
jgi:hypothetical protein